MKNACLSVDDTKCFVNKIIFKEEVVIIICDSFIMTPCINELRPPPLPSYHHPDSITTSSQYKQPRVTSTHVSSHTCIIILSPPVSFSLLPSQFLRNKSIHVWQYHSHKSAPKQGRHFIKYCCIRWHRLPSTFMTYLGSGKSG